MKETEQQIIERLAKETDSFAEPGKPFFINWEEKEIQERVINILVKKYGYQQKFKNIVIKTPFEKKDNNKPLQLKS